VTTSPEAPSRRRWGRPKPTAEEERAPRILRKSVYNEAPPSVAELVAFIRAGGIVPGAAPEWLERLGKLYGYGILVPVSLANYTCAWLFQRPGRLALAALFVTATWVARTGGPL
jgi:hypothetical protein